MRELTVTTAEATETVAADALFIAIGGRARSDWVGDEGPARDAAGYLLTGRDLPPAAWELDRASLPLETSVPGFFVAGDVRHGSTKRVAAAVGEGAMAVASVHQLLASS